jgi:hypothetical protein
LAVSREATCETAKRASVTPVLIEGCNSVALAATPKACATFARIRLLFFNSSRAATISVAFVRARHLYFIYWGSRSRLRPGYFMSVPNHFLFTRSQPMRVVLSIALVMIALAASALITAQNRNEPKNQTTKEEVKAEPQKGSSSTSALVPDKKIAPEKSTSALTSRAILARLRLEIETQPFKERIKFKVLLDSISEQLQAGDKEVTINVDVEAFQNNSPESASPMDEVVIVNSNRKRATVIDLLSLVVKQLGKPGAIVVRAGRVDIVPLAYTSKEYMFNQTFRADFKEQRLDVALEELSDLTGVSIVLDPRAKEKMKTAVTARFNDDVAMQDAMRMLTEMAELKIVYLVTGMYITTPEHARVMQKELKDLYEPKMPAGFFGPGMGPCMLPDPDTSMSPLNPPLPPPTLRGKRLEAAA